MFSLFAKINQTKVAKRLKQYQRGIRDAIDDTSEFAADIALKHTLQRFEAAGRNKRAQQSYTGEQWRSPRESTLRNRKKNRGGSNQSLVDTGLMRDSIRARLRKGRKEREAIIFIRPGVRYPKKKGSIAVSTVAKLQQRGYITAPGSRIPGRYVAPRRFMGIDEDTERVIRGNLSTRLKAKLFGFG